MRMRAARVGAWLLLGLACLDVIGRQISRLGLSDWIGGSAWPLAWSLLIAAAAAVTLLASSARRPRSSTCSRSWRRRRRSSSSA